MDVGKGTSISRSIVWAMGREVELYRSMQGYICEIDWDIA